MIFSHCAVAHQCAGDDLQVCHETLGKVFWGNWRIWPHHQKHDALSMIRKLMVWRDNSSALSVCHEKRKVENHYSRDFSGTGTMQVLLIWRMIFWGYYAKGKKKNLAPVVPLYFAIKPTQGNFLTFISLTFPWDGESCCFKCSAPNVTWQIFAIGNDMSKTRKALKGAWVHMVPQPLLRK